MEVEEDNIDPLVAPPLLAQPTPSLYYPPSLRLRFPTYAHLRPLETRETVLARMLSYVLEEGPFQKGEIYEDHPYVRPLCFSPDSLRLRHFLNFRYPFALLLLRFFISNRKLARRRALLWSRRISAGFPKILRGPQRVGEREGERETERSTTSLKINSVKESADIRGLREDFTPADSVLHSLSLYLSISHLSFALVILFSLHALAYP